MTYKSNGTRQNDVFGQKARGTISVPDEFSLILGKYEIPAEDHDALGNRESGTRFELQMIPGHLSMYVKLCCQVSPSLRLQS
jgi:hypothetical protein